MEPLETIKVEQDVVACEGGPNAALGHPRVFLNMEGRGQVDCPYCGRRYILKEGAKAGHGH
jgi:NADH dehydrogenase (ubiquinone) Fe-S protein 6